VAPYLESSGGFPVSKLRQVYLGAGYEDAEIGKVLATYKIRFLRLDDPAKSTAELLAQGKIIGWFQGRMEFGPRALGNRSM
jgi:carbamoyltransferase